MKLEEIGFYTLSDRRALRSSHKTPLHRCELLLTDRCNFNCPYCRKRGGPDLSWVDACTTILHWEEEGPLRNVRFSGGEPTVWPRLLDLVEFTVNNTHVEHVALSTNGSARWDVYHDLIDLGVNDFSVSLDACCASTAKKMAGGVDAFERICRNIELISQYTYVTVGVVVTKKNVDEVPNIVILADKLGADDVRLISAAQWNEPLQLPIPQRILDRCPILRYRHANMAAGRHVRGIGQHDCGTCWLALDDMAVMGGEHYPCIIHLREGGAPIGKVGPNMREDRRRWVERHNTHKDPICKANCLDVCVDYNNCAQRRCYAVPAETP